MSKPTKPTKDEVRAKLKAFLQEGQSDDVASVLVHALNDRAEKLAQNKPAKKPAGKPKKK